MTNEDKKFIIDQLRKDKIIYATEACATSLVCILVFLFSTVYIQGQLKNIVNIGALIVSIGYTLYMGKSNLARLIKIKELEKELKLEISFYLKG